MSPPPTRTVSHQYFIRASPKRVFAAVTKPVWITKWLCNEAQIDGRKGGRYALAWKDGPRHSGTIIEFDPDRCITFSWAWEGVKLKGTRLRLSVKPSRGGSLLLMEHSGFPRKAEWVDLYAGAEWGWTYFAMNLKSVLETGTDLRSKCDG